MVTHRVDAAICKDLRSYTDYLQATGWFQVEIKPKGEGVKVHHTKFKGDIAVAKVIADLVDKGHVPCLPFSEHQPYDLVVVQKNGAVVKVQVKYATLKKNGTVEVKFRTGWVDKNGLHMRSYQERDFDFYAIYCPQKEKVVYVPNVPQGPKVIRFERPGNHQGKRVSWENNYLDLSRESSETIRRTPEMAKT